MGGEGQLFLLAVGDDVLATEPLPAQGSAVLGRAEDADLRIDDRSVSREHARLHIDAGLAIEDLGSANGTWVDNVRIPPNTPTPLQLDQAIRVGSVTVLVQRRSKQLTVRRRRSHEYFEYRLEEECARARRRSQSFMLAHVVAEDPDSDIEEAVSIAMRDSDIVAAYARGELELLLLDTDRANADRVVLRIQQALAESGFAARVGAACFPEDGRDPSTLVAHARSRAYGDQSITLPDDLVIADERMHAIHELAGRIAATDISVLLLGETGVGKEVIAEQLHRRSARAAKPFLRLNCAALTESLLESELFGHERGAFTGAMQTKQGLLEVADGGVVFLDEVGEMQASTQAKLLRVLDERKLMRVGGVTPIDIDVRLISATNRDLDAEVERGTFRRDLLYRLNAMTIVIPPLRERPNEIEALAKYFLSQTATKYGRQGARLAPAAIAALRAYPWPGNIRELRNTIERAVVISVNNVIDVDDLPLERLRGTFHQTTKPMPFASRSSAPELDEEHRKIVAALEACAGNQTHAARMLGISRRALINKIEKFGVTRPRKR